MSDVVSSKVTGCKATITTRLITISPKNRFRNRSEQWSSGYLILNCIIMFYHCLQWLLQRLSPGAIKGPTLVVCPAAAMLQWRNEILRFTQPGGESLLGDICGLGWWKSCKYHQIPIVIRFDGLLMYFDVIYFNIYFQIHHFVVVS